MLALEDIKNKILTTVPLDELIGDTIKPQRKSGRITGLCPFHAEKTPSFYIYDDHYHCFGCKAHGDAITYVQKTQGLGFLDALRWLANKYGIDASALERSSFDKAELKEKSIHSRLLVAAQDYFVRSLNSPHGEKVRVYLQERGFDSNSIKAFGFGYAPKSRADLAIQMKSLGFEFEMLKKCSLVNGDERHPYDFFQDRVMIPIRDLQGRLIAFGGRILGNGEPQKYKNSRYDKGYVLFGMDTARKAMRNTSRAIVVEGYMDALQMWQNGFPETVACQGTALTLHHMKQLKNAVSTIYLMFDGDSAGYNASLKLVDNAMQIAGVEFKVVKLPEGEDPDHFARNHTKEELEALLKGSQELIDHCIHAKLTEAPNTAIPQLISQEFVPWLLNIDDLIKRDYLVSRLSQKTGISAESIRTQLKQPSAKSKYNEREKRVKSETSGVISQENKNTKQTPLSALAKELLGHLYYATSDEIDPTELLRFVKEDLGEAEIWESFASEILSSLELGTTPSEQDIGAWACAHSPEVGRFIMWLQDCKEAFFCHNRGKMIKKLQLTHRQKNLKKQVSYLKNKLAIGSRIQLTSDNDLNHIISMISDISQELKDLQSELSKC
ncbi:MAG: DNA primase [Bdellovibrionota bacterium]